MEIRASIASRLFGKSFSVPALNDVPQVKVITVGSKHEYDEMCKCNNLGTVVSVNASSTGFHVATMTRVIPVMVKDVCIGKIHFRFYESARKVKRNFVAFDPQVRKLICGRRDRFALLMVDWDGDASEIALCNLAKQACNEIERMVAEQPTKSNTAPKKGVGFQVQATSGRKKPEVPVNFPAVAKANVRETNKDQLVAPKGSANRAAKGDVRRGYVAEFGKTMRSGSGGATYEAFCLKLDVDGSHLTFYGVELERECAERGVKPGQLIEIVSMGKQTTNGGFHKNLYQIKILEK